MICDTSIFIGSAFILIGSTVAYHVSQKSIPAHVHPVVSVIFTFFIALAVSLAILPLFVGKRELTMSVKHIHGANLFSGISIVGIVVGHILYYRSGWSLSTGTLFSYVTVCVFLVPIGLIVFREKINLYNIAGIFVSLVGLYLLTRK